MNTKKNIVNSPFYNLTQFHIVKKTKKINEKNLLEPRRNF